MKIEDVLLEFMLSGGGSGGDGWGGMFLYIDSDVIASITDATDYAELMEEFKRMTLMQLPKYSKRGQPLFKWTEKRLLRAMEDIVSGWQASDDIYTRLTAAQVEEQTNDGAKLVRMTAKRFAMSQAEALIKAVIEYSQPDDIDTLKNKTVQQRLMDVYGANKKPSNKLIQLAKHDAEGAAYYARVFNDKKPWPPGEPAILAGNLPAAAHYCVCVNRPRWPELEQKFIAAMQAGNLTGHNLRDTIYGAALYAHQCLNNEWPEMDRLISQLGQQAYGQYMSDFEYLMRNSRK